MKHKFLSLLGVFCLLCSSQVWGGLTVNGGTFYFANNKMKWTPTDKIQLFVGKSGYTSVYDMTKISHTKLYYYNMSSWSGATYIRFADASYGSGEFGPDNVPTRSTATFTSDYTFNSNSLYLFYPKANSQGQYVSGASLNSSPYISSYSDLNSKQYVEVKVSTDQGVSYVTPATSPASLSLAGYAFSDYKTCGTEKSNTEITKNGSIIHMGSTIGYASKLTLSVTAQDDAYDFMGWYDGKGTKLSDATTYETYDHVAKDTIYARFVEKFVEQFYDVTISDNGTETVKQASTITAASVTAAGKEDYKFTGWTIPDGIILNGCQSTDATISFFASKAATITANYEELPKVYFDNTVSWSNVYVYFNAYWDSYNDPSRGAGAKGQPYGKMKQIGETNRYYFAYDVASPSAQIAFASADMHDYDNFYGHKAVYRADFNACRPVFTPDASAETKTYNTTTYYNTGYWQTLDTHTGTYFVYTDNWDTDPDREFIRQDVSATRGMMSIYLAEGTYEFKILTCAGTHYGNNGTITTNIGLDGGGWVFETNKGNCTIKANAAGNYTFYYDFYSRELWVIYPTYYLKHPWDGENWSWKNCDIINTDGTYTLYADYMSDGVNYNTKADDEGRVYCTTGNGKLILVGNPQVGKPARFTFDPEAANVTVENMYFPITMNKYGYATLYHKENLQIPAGVTAKYVMGTSGVLLSYQEVQGGVIPKETGVMLFAPANTQMEFVGVAEANEEAPENIMKGSHDAKEVDNDSIHYILTTNDANQVGMFWPYDTDEGVGEFTNAANKAYIELPGTTTQPAGVMARKGFLFVEEANTPTELVEMQNASRMSDVHKFVNNGQLRISRNGVIYNATGQMIK